MEYHKLVRDNIPAHIEARGGMPIVHIADDVEYGMKLKEKLQEEVKEYCDAENIEELADILEVVDAIIAYKQFDSSEVGTVRQKKAEERGRFEKRIILDAA